MNISKICTNLTNKAKITILPKEQSKEVRELYDDMVKNTNYKDIIVKRTDKNNISISGDAHKPNSMSIHLDFKNNEQIQIEKSKSYVFRSYLPNNNITQVIKGNIGGPVKRVKTTNLATNSHNSDYIKSTCYENYVSGNVFIREETSLNFLRKNKKKG